MRILFIGGVGHIENQELRERFYGACRAIGKACAKAEIEIVVSSEKQTTADRHVVLGASEAAKERTARAQRPVVRVIRSHAASGKPFSGNEFAAVEVKHERHPGTPESIRLQQVRESDAVVVICGSGGVAIAAYVALALHKPVVVVPSFGGRAQTLWDQFKPYYDGLGKYSEKANLLREAWDDENADVVVLIAKRLLATRVFEPRPGFPVGLLLASLLVCLAIWTILFAHPNAPDLVYSYFSILVVAGMLGTILRTALRLMSDPSAKFSFQLVLIELAAGVALGFALTLLYLAGAITFQGDTKVISTGEPFQRVAVVMTVLGLGGGLAIEKASDRVARFFDQQFRSGQTGQ